MHVTIERDLDEISDFVYISFSMKKGAFRGTGEVSRTMNQK